jgi:hypothetical protein
VSAVCFSLFARLIAHADQQTSTPIYEPSIEAFADSFLRELDRDRELYVRAFMISVLDFPEKVTLLGHAVGLVNLRNPEFGALIATTAGSAFRAALVGGGCWKAKILLRFMGELVASRALHAESLLAVFTDLLRAAQEPGATRLRVDVSIFLVLQSLVWSGAALRAHAPMDLMRVVAALENCMDRRAQPALEMSTKFLSILADAESPDAANTPASSSSASVTPATPTEKSTSLGEGLPAAGAPPNEARAEAIDTLGLVWSIVRALHQGDYADGTVPHLSAAQSRKLESATAHVLADMVPLPALPQTAAVWPFPRTSVSLFRPAEVPQHVKLPPMHTPGRFLLEEMVRDVLFVSDNKRTEVTRRVLDLPLASSAAIAAAAGPLREYVAVEVVLKEMLRLPRAPHAPAYYVSVLLELLQVDRMTILPVLRGGISALTRQLGRLELECVDRLAECVSMLLNNLSYQWPYGDFLDGVGSANYDDVDVNRAAYFVRELFLHTHRYVVS